MTSKNARRLAATLTLLVVSMACERDLTDLEPAEFPTNAEVFLDNFAPGMDFASFGPPAKTDALAIDEEVVYEGTASMRFDIPAFGDPSGSFAGGAFYLNGGGRDLGDYNALTFWARSSRRAVLNEIGFGDDPTNDPGEVDRFRTRIAGLELFTSWQKFVVPIPDPDAVTQLKGLLWLADGTDDGDAYSIWIDEVKFENVPGVGTPQAEVLSRVASMAVGDVIQGEITIQVPVGAGLLTVEAGPAYVAWTSSDPSVATVSETGLITKVAEGTAEITASVGDVAAAGSITVQDGSGLEGIVFDDAYSAGVFFDTFGDNADPNAVSLDDTEAFQGIRSLRVDIPAVGDPAGFFAGGVLKTEEPRDLSGFDALVFWAKAETAATLDLAGFGNDNTGTSQFIVNRTALPVGTDWQRYVIPIPDPSDLTAEGGLFTFAEGSEGGPANTIWFDEIAFVNLEELGAAQPVLAGGTFNLAVGDTTSVDYSLSFPVGTETVSVDASARYFEWASSEPTVATVSATGVITMVAEGSSDITATLGGVAAQGAVTVTTGGGGGAQIDLPITFDDADVNYVFTDFGGGGPTTLAADPTDGSNTVARTVRGAGSATFAGVTMTDPDGLATPIPFTATSTSMTVRVYSPDAGVPVRLKVEDNGDPTRSVETEAVTTVANTWETLTFDFSTPAPGTAALNLAFTYDKATIFFDFGTDGAPDGEKVYLWDDVEFGGGSGGGGGGDAPTVPAPTPTQDAADVISLFSDAYTDVPVNRFASGFDGSTTAFSEVTVAGNPTLLYETLNYEVAEFTGANSIDASGMTNFRMDIWTPNATEFGVNLVDFGADNAFDGGDDSQQRLLFTASSTPPLAQGQWISLDIPLAQFTGLTSVANLSQLVIDAVPAGTTTVYVDNIYFYNDGGSGGGGGAFDGGEIANGSFESGDLTSWVDPAPGSGSLSVLDTDSNSGTFSAQAQVGVGQNVFLQQNNVAAGTVADGDQIDISFFVKGTLEAGAVLQTSASWEAGTTGLITPEGSAAPLIDNTSATEWTEYTFSTTVSGGNLANGFSLQLQLVCGGAAGCNGDIVIDDISLTVTPAGGGGGGGGAFDGGEIANGSFETGDLTSWVDPAPGSGSLSVVDTDSNSGTFSAQAQVGVGQNIFLQQNNVAAGTVADGDQIDISLFVKGTLEAGAVLQTSASWEAGTTGLITPEGSAAPLIDNTSATEWTEYTFSTTLSGGNLANGFSLQLQLVCGGAAGCNGDIVIDDISLTVTPGGGGGGGGGGGAISLPITFDDGAVTEADLQDFEGGGPSTLVADPVDAGNTVVQTVKSATAGAFAGVTMTGADGLASPIPFTASATTMTVRVYSPDAGIEVRLKVEENGDPTRSVETGATTTVANGWETLTFNFSNQTTGTSPINLTYVYDKISIFFNIGVDGPTAGAKTYFWDDVTFQN